MKYKLLIGLIALLIIPLASAANPVDIEPDNPNSLDNLTCIINGTGNYFYNWYVNGQDSGIDNYKLDSSLTIRDQIWKCYVETYVPMVGYIPIGEDSVTILNTPPVLDNINDITVNETDLIDLSLIVNASDIDSEDTLTFTYTPPINSSGQWQTNYTSAGIYPVTVTVSDGDLNDSQDITITVNNVNRLPNITSVTSPNGSEGDTLDFSFTVADSDTDDLLAYTISKNGTLLATNNSYQWVTDYDDAGVYNFSFVVSDGKGGTDIESRTVTIADVNRPPTITNIIAPTSVIEGNLLSVAFTAEDIDNDPITYQILRNGTVVSNISSYNWNTNLTSAGVYNFTFTASDPFASTSNSTTITVASYDLAPAITNITAPDGAENQTHNVSFNATDPDGDLFNYTIKKDDVVVSNTSSYQWTPDFNESGTYTFTFIASNALNDTETRTITINNTNRAPNITTKIVLPTDSYVGVNINMGFNANDPDEDELTYQILLNDAVLVNTNETIWTATLGTHNITYYVTDGELNDSDTNTINVIYAATGNIVINEFLVNSSTSDFVEIYNNDSLTIDVSNWDVNDLAGSLYTIPAITILNPGEFYYDNISNSRLTGTGDTITLTNSTADIIDTKVYTSDPGIDISIGRFPDGTDNWHNLTTPTPGSANVYGSWIINSTINGTLYPGSNYLNLNGIYGSTINISTITGPTIYVRVSDIYNSIITNSTVDNCNISDSILTNSPCKDATIDPSNIINSDTTGSTIIDSNITDSNATYSNVTDSEIEDAYINDSLINQSQVYESNIINSSLKNLTAIDESLILDSNLNRVGTDDAVILSSNLTNCIQIGHLTYITNSNMVDSHNISFARVNNSNITNTSNLVDINITDANITNDVLYSGTISQYNNTYTYNGTPINLIEIINYRPEASIESVSPNPGEIGETIAFKADSTDPNVGAGTLNDTLLHIWRFMDGNTENTTSDTITHKFDTKGEYNVLLETRDSFGLGSTDSIEVTIEDKSDKKKGSSGSGGGSAISIQSIIFTEEGVTKIIKENSKLRFQFDEEYHTITLADVREKEVDIIVQSYPVVALLEIGETANFLLNNDTKEDMSVTLESTLEKSAKLTVKKLGELSQIEVNQTLINETDDNATEDEITDDEEIIESEWADYIEEEEEISSDFVKNIAVKIGSFCKKTALRVYNFINNIPYLKYIIAGIIILAIIIAIILFTAKNKKKKWKKIANSLIDRKSVV